MDFNEKLLLNWNHILLCVPTFKWSVAKNMYFRRSFKTFLRNFKINYSLQKHTNTSACCHTALFIPCQMQLEYPYNVKTPLFSNIHGAFWHDCAVVKPGFIAARILNISFSPQLSLLFLSAWRENPCTLNHVLSLTSGQYKKFQQILMQNPNLARFQVSHLHISFSKFYILTLKSFIPCGFCFIR